MNDSQAAKLIILILGLCFLFFMSGLKIGLTEGREEALIELKKDL